MADLTVTQRWRLKQDISLIENTVIKLLEDAINKIKVKELKEEMASAINDLDGINDQSVERILDYIIRSVEATLTNI